MFLGPEGRKQLAAAGAVASIGIELAVCICIGYFGGLWLDSKLHTAWISWVGLGFGLAAGYRSLYRLARKYRSASSKTEPASQDDPSKPS